MNEATRRLGRYLRPSTHEDHYPDVGLSSDDDEACGCCELHEYGGNIDEINVSCPICGHSPEEHE